MARSNKSQGRYDRHSAPADSAPSRLDQSTMHARLETQERAASNWRRNVLACALLLIVAAGAYFWFRQG
jgi:hypothetical protein